MGGCLKDRSFGAAIAFRRGSRLAYNKLEYSFIPVAELIMTLKH
jgi:hypothetical protein